MAYKLPLYNPDELAPDIDPYAPIPGPAPSPPVQPVGGEQYVPDAPMFQAPNTGSSNYVTPNFIDLLGLHDIRLPSFNNDDTPVLPRNHTDTQPDAPMWQAPNTGSSNYIDPIWPSLKDAFKKATTSSESDPYKDMPFLGGFSSILRKTVPAPPDVNDLLGIALSAVPGTSGAPIVLKPGVSALKSFAAHALADTLEPVTGAALREGVAALKATENEILEKVQPIRKAIQQIIMDETGHARMGRDEFYEANPERGFAKHMRETSGGDLGDYLENNRQSYEVKPNEELLRQAYDAISNAPKRTKVIMSIMSSDKPLDDVTMTAGEILVKDLISGGDVEAGVDLAVKLSEQWTEAGRVVQAANIWDKLSPEGIVVFAQKAVAAGNKKNSSAVAARMEEATRNILETRINETARARIEAIEFTRRLSESAEVNVSTSIRDSLPVDLQELAYTVRKFLSDETGAIRWMPKTVKLLPADQAVRVLEEAERISQLKAGPERDLLKENLLKSLETEVSQVSPDAATRISEAVVDAWNAKERASSAWLSARNTSTAINNLVKKFEDIPDLEPWVQKIVDANSLPDGPERTAAWDGIRSELKALKASGVPATPEEIAARTTTSKVIQSAIRREEVHLNTLARQAEAYYDKQVKYLTGQEAGAAIKKVRSDERIAINELRKSVRISGPLSNELAVSFLQRAKTLAAMPVTTMDEQYAKHITSNKLLDDIHNLVPPDRWDTVLSILSIPRSIKASSDFSFPMRQGIFQMSRPEWYNMFYTNIKSFMSEEVSRAADARVLFGQFGNVRAETGLAFVDRFGPLVKGEEFFMSAMTRNAPIIKNGERAYIASGNVLRSDVWDSIVKGWLKPELRDSTFTSIAELAAAAEKPEQAFHDLSKWLNVTTGRGDIDWFKRSGHILNALFFAPRFFASRIQIPYYATKFMIQDPVLRKEIGRDVGSFVVSNMTMLLLLQKSHLAEVEWDARSPDFGRARIGPLRFDFWAGYQPLVRYAAQAGWQQNKAYGTGTLYDKPMHETMFNFLRTKLNIAPGQALDQFMGEKPSGEVLANLQDRVLHLANILVPIISNDVWQTIQEDWKLTTIAVPITLFGGSEAAYHKMYDVQNKVSRRDFNGAAYIDLTPTQKSMVNRTPEVEAERADMDRRYFGKQKPRGIQALDDYNTRKDELAQNLLKGLNSEAPQKVKTAYVREFKANLFQAGQALFNPEVATALERGKDTPFKDVIRNQYWALEPEVDYNTGKINSIKFKTQRAAVLERALDKGVDPEYVKDRGIRFKDPRVNAAVEAHEHDIEILSKEYFDIDENVATEFPNAPQTVKDRISSERKTRLRLRDHAVQAAGERLYEWKSPDDPFMPNIPRVPTFSIPRPRF